MAVAAALCTVALSAAAALLAGGGPPLAPQRSAAARPPPAARRCADPRLCGIVAVFDDLLSAEEIKELTVELTRRLEHRGPDSVGFHGGDGFGLGHARLSIMDPEAGKQPLVSQATGAAVVHNGEIYNHAALREEWAAVRTAAGKAPFSFTTGSDSEVVLPLFEDLSPAELAAKLDGMFGVVAASADGKDFVAVRDPVGIKPLYRGWSRDGGRVIFASELKCLVGVVEHAELVPPGHVWTRERGYERYFDPEWLAPLSRPDAPPPPLGTRGTDRVRSILKAAVQKRLMSDVGYGLLLSGGLDSAIVAKLMSELTDMSTIKSFTVGMANSPDIMAARAIADVFGTEHHEYIFTPEEAFSILPKVVEHLETYEPELIRSSIPNYFLAKLAGSHTKVVLTGEGSDELFAGYLYFRDAPDKEALHKETLRIFDHLASVNLQRSDRMGMAHGLEARVPFLDVDMLRELYAEVDPQWKMHETDAEAEGGARMEKWALRRLFEGDIPHEVLWRTKAMQCEGVGTNWVERLQEMCADAVSDAEFAAAADRFPLNPPQSKEEYYYRALFETHFKGFDQFVHVWEGGCRAGGAPWQNSAYTRAGLKDTAQLQHGLMEGVDVVTEAATGKKVAAAAAAKPRAGSPAMAATVGSTPLNRRFVVDSPSHAAPSAVPPCSLRGGGEGGRALEARLGALLATGGDSRSRLHESGDNAYHCPSVPAAAQVVRGSCTGSPPAKAGFESALVELQSLEVARQLGGFEQAFGDAMEGVRARLASALGLPAGSGVVLMPSGTDAEYIPLAILQQLYPGAPIRSVLAAAGETGSGGERACAAQYFDETVPLGAAARQAGARLEGFPPVELRSIAARCGEGEVVDAAAALSELEWSPTDAEPAWLLRTVVGSKTGFATAPLAAPSDRSLTVLDLCQLRVSAEEVRAGLEQEAVLLVTGSKFFQGAAFSSAVILPPSLMERLRQGAPSAPPLPAGLRDFLSQHEVPASLPHWRGQLGSDANLGLLLRWHTALPFVERAFRIPAEERAALEADWMRRVSEMVAEVPGLEVLHAERGIVSLTLRKPDGALCTKEELKWVHKHMATDASSLWSGDASPPPEAATRIFIGQPVGITDEYAALRLAMGAELLLEAHAGEYDPEVDARVVRKLRWLLRALNRSRAREALRTADAICFDVDATVIREEGINRLATHNGCGEQIEAMTVRTMEGDTPFHEALRERLDIIRPSQSDVASLIAQNAKDELLSPGVADLVRSLHESGRPVFLLSGGFRQIINPFAAQLGVEESHVYANTLLFDEQGDYSGVDPTELTSQPSGKARVISMLKETHGFEKVVMIGDGANDMSARDCPDHAANGADVFIGFGGVKVRETVRQGADWFVTDFNELSAEL